MRIASITVAEPSALSVAPVPVCHESRCAPTITISSLIALSVPGISAMTLWVLRSLFVEGRLDLDGELHRNLLLQHARDQVVVLGRQDDRRHRVGALIASGDEQRAVLADVRLDRHGDALRLQHREPLGVELRRTGRTRIGRFQIAAGCRTVGANRVLLDRAGEQDRALQFSGLRFHRRVFEARHPHRRGDDASGGRRRPALRISDQGHVARLDHLDR